MLLLLPIVVLNEVQRAVYRFIVIFIAAASFVVVVTVASTATMAEIFAAGAAYAAVMVVFVSGNGVQSNGKLTS